MNATQFQAFLEKQLKSGSIYSIVMAVQSKSKGIDLASAAGIADPKTKQPMTVDTPYFLASISKMYTTAVIVKLQEQGVLNLDESISKYLPANLIDGIHVYKGTDYSHQIKVYQLLEQTTGLADYFEGKQKSSSSLFDLLKAGEDRTMDIEQVVQIVRGLSSGFVPGTKAQYSDTNFQLLGAIIESVTEKPIANSFEEIIFAPLGLQRTTLYNHPQSPSEHPPAIFYFKEQALRIPKFMSSNAPDGGVVSTAAESQLFLQAFFEGKLFDRRFFDRMMHQWNRIFFPFQYGYGMMRFKLPRIFTLFQASPELIGHSGSTGSFAFYAPEKSLYLTGTINQIAASNKPFQLMLRIINALD